MGLLASGALMLWFGARSEAGTRWLLAQVPGLTAEGVQGTLFSSRLRIDALQWQGGAQLPAIRVDGLEWAEPRWQWRPHDGAWVGLTLSRLQATRLTWRSTSSNKSLWRPGKANTWIPKAGYLRVLPFPPMKPSWLRRSEGPS